MREKNVCASLCCVAVSLFGTKKPRELVAHEHEKCRSLSTSASLVPHKIQNNDWRFRAPTRERANVYPSKVNSDKIT